MPLTFALALAQDDGDLMNPPMHNIHLCPCTPPTFSHARAQDDGDLMKLLFGVADEMPTMATIHLHKFPSHSAASYVSEPRQDQVRGEDALIMYQGWVRTQYPLTRR